MPQLDESVQLNDDDLRCPHCAKRISADDHACPACGFELLPHHARIHCKRCGSRILASLQVCPHCHADPRAGPIPPIVGRIGLALVAITLVVCVGWIIFRALATNTLPRILGLTQPPLTPTEMVQIIHVVATSAPPTTAATFPSLLDIRGTPTPTPRGGRTATAASPAAIQPPGGFYPAVQLLAPANATVYSGSGAVIRLEWRTVSPTGLHENEWYEIKITGTGQGNAPLERKSYSKETNWTVSADLYKDISTNTRLFKWTVTVVRVDGINPFASPNRTPISPTSTTSSFYWN